MLKDKKSSGGKLFEYCIQFKLPVRTEDKIKIFSDMQELKFTSQKSCLKRMYYNKRMNVRGKMWESKTVVSKSTTKTYSLNNC